MDEDAAGVTYLAQAPGGTRGYAALKVYGPRDDVEAVLSRYRRWQPALAGLVDPGIARLLDVGLTVDGRLFVASEYIAGWPLTALRSHASVGAAERAELARQLTSAIDAVHEAGLVHLKLDASKVRLSMTYGPRATVLGLGSSLIVDGASGSPEVDRLALAAVLRELDGESPPSTS
jgi:serine/threonine-protein kinase